MPDPDTQLVDDLYRHLLGRALAVAETPTVENRALLDGACRLAAVHPEAWRILRLLAIRAAVLERRTESTP